MILSMDLNASPVPEEDDEHYEEQVQGEITHEEHAESAAATMRRVCNALCARERASSLWLHQ